MFKILAGYRASRHIHLGLIKMHSKSMYTFPGETKNQAPPWQHWHATSFKHTQVWFVPILSHTSALRDGKTSQTNRTTYKRPEHNYYFPVHSSSFVLIQKLKSCTVQVTNSYQKQKQKKKQSGKFQILKTSYFQTVPLASTPTHLPHAWNNFWCYTWVTNSMLLSLSGACTRTQPTHGKILVLQTSH